MAVTLCGASWYNQKYFFNPDFSRIPKDVQEELQILCVSFTEDVGGVLTIEFGEDIDPTKYEVNGVAYQDQLVIELVALFGPGAIVGVGYVLVGLTYTYLFMCVLGLAFIATYPLWIRNIYNRMMQRRYENIEGFHTTRQ